MTLTCLLHSLVQMNMVKDTQSLKPVEVVFLTYLLGSALIILVFRTQLDVWIDQIVVRALALFLVIGYTLMRQSRFISFFRIFTPFFFLSYFYAESALFHKLVFSDLLDQYFAGLDQYLFGWQPSIEFSKHFSATLFSELMFFGYFSYYVLIIGLPVYIYWVINKEIGERFAFIIVNSLLIYYVIFSLFPVAGPQFYFNNDLIQVPAGYVFEPVIRLIQGMAERPTGAFPSSHVSICLMLVWGCMKYARKWIYLVVPTAVLLILSTVYIGAHYVVDVLGGILFTPVIYWFSGWLYDLLSRHHFKLTK